MGRFSRFGNDLYSGRRSIDFVGRRRLWYLVAGLLVGLSLLALLVRGINPGIEFRGGSEFRVSGVEDTSEIRGQEAVGDVVSGTEARVSIVGGDSVRVQTQRLDDRQTDQVRAALAEAYDVEVTDVTASFVGPTWGRDVSGKAIQGLVAFLVLVSLVIGAYFRTWTMAVAALVALFHDLVLTVGVYALVGFEVTPASVIGFLTILGYSLYDTVVVFDKVRENTDHITASTKRTYAEAANLAVNQTLVRSINTSVVALLPVAAILFIGAFLLGAGTLKDISLALFVGIAAGTYSSIFIATPLLVDLRRREPELVAQAQRVAKRRAQEAGRSAAGEGDDEHSAVGEPVAATVVGGRGSGATAVTTVPAAGGAQRTAQPSRSGGQRPQPRRAGPGRRGGKR